MYSVSRVAAQMDGDEGIEVGGGRFDLKEGQDGSGAMDQHTTELAWSLIMMDSNRSGSSGSSDIAVMHVGCLRR